MFVEPEVRDKTRARTNQRTKNQTSPDTPRKKKLRHACNLKNRELRNLRKKLNRKKL